VGYTGRDTQAANTAENRAFSSRCRGLYNPFNNFDATNPDPLGTSDRNSHAESRPPPTPRHPTTDGAKIDWR